MIIIVTGASSFLGRACCAELKRQGAQVIGLRHSFEEQEELLPDKADVWLHFAWAGLGSAGRSDPSIQEYNVEMTLSAVRKAAQLGCERFVFAGSQAEYGHAQDGEQKKEYGPVSPVSEYGRAKLRVLEEKRRYCYVKDEIFARNTMKYVHMRIFSVFGPGDHEHSLINTLIRGFERGEDIALGSCEQLWNYMYIDDAARAVALVCSKADGGIINVGGEDTKKLKDYVYRVWELTGGKGRAVFGMRPDNAEGPADLSPDTGRLRELGFVCATGFDDGVIMTAKSLGYIL